MFGFLRSRFLSLLAIEWLWLVVVLPCVCLMLTSTSSIKLLDNFIYDRLLSQHVQAVDSRIAMIDIDERSLEKIGVWPWPRTTHAQLLNQLHLAQPKSVLLDVILTEPDEQPSHDVALSNALKQFEHIALPALLLPKGEVTVDSHSQFNEVLPIPILAQNAQVGHVLAQPDDDNVVRRIYLSLNSHQTTFPALAAQASLLVDNPTNADTTRSNPSQLIPFIAPGGSYIRVPYVDVLEGRVSAEDLFKNRYVLIGARVSGLGDQYVTPFGTMSGVDIQATILDGLLNNRSIKTLGSVEMALLQIAPIVLLLVGFVWLNERYHLLLLLVAVAVFGFLIAAALWYLGIWLPPASTGLMLLLAYLLWSWRRLSAAMRYFDGEIRLMMQSPSQLRTLLMHVSPSTYSKHTSHRRSLTTLIQQVGDLQHFMTYSLLQAQPMAMLVFEPSGVIVLSNQKAQHMVPNMWPELSEAVTVERLFAWLEPSSSTWVGWRDAPNYAWLNGVEVKVSVTNKVYQTQTAQVQMEGVGAVWLLSFVDLTQERETQRNYQELIEFLSHDMRTPLVNILSLVQLHAHDETQISKTEMTTEVKHNVHRALTFAENMVLLAHAKTGDYAYSELNLAPIVSLAIGQVWAQAKQKDIQLEWLPVSDELSEQCWLNADGELIERVIINVLTNAIRYSPEHSKVSIVLNIPDQTHVLCCISDQGCGMTELQTQRLMQGEVVSDSSRTHVDAAGSMGIGFSMVRAIMHRHGGWVKVQSRIGFGSCVTLGFKRLLETDNVDDA